VSAARLRGILGLAIDEVVLTDPTYAGWRVVRRSL